MTAQHLAGKFRRAMRNGTGTHFTVDEIRWLDSLGVLAILSEAEAEELRAKWADNQNIRSATIGSPEGRMGARHIGKSAGMTKAQRQRAALALVANG